MSKRKNRKQGKTPAQPRRKRQTAAMVAGLLCVLVTVGVFARWPQMRLAPMLNAAVEPAAAPNSLAANNPVKEYIYAGGRLLATEEPAPAPTPCTPPSAVKVSISEFRLRGPHGASDEFVELYNHASSPVTVCAPDDTTGWTLATRSVDGSGVSPLFIVPNGTTIPARGHYLAINSNGYSLGTNTDGPNLGAPQPPYTGGISLDPKNLGETAGRVGNYVYETGNTMNNNFSSMNDYIGANIIEIGSGVLLNRLAANGDRQYNTDTGDSAGLALFMTANPANFTQDYRLDSVGFSNMTGANAGLYREGAGLSPIGNTDGEYSFVRKQTSGYPQDTNDNGADFVFISTSGGTFGGVRSVLGAPSPENLASPVNCNVSTSVFDPGVALSLPPNRVRCGPCTGPNATYGTITFRRTFTNNTGRTLTRLRFRLIDLTTLGSPGYTPGGTQADLRALSSGDVTVTRSDGSAVPVKGTVVEAPPDQPLGGGLNASLVVPLGDSGLPAGASIHAQFAFGVEQNGNFRFVVIVEALS